jgi:hypothetical protein
MLSAEVKITAGLIEKVRALSEDKRKNIFKVFEAKGYEMVMKAAENVPVDTGELKRSLRIMELKMDLSGVTLRVGSHLNYSLEQEVNESYHHKIGGPHYLRNAFFTTLPSLIDEVNKSTKAV